MLGQFLGKGSRMPVWLKLAMQILTGCTQPQISLPVGDWHRGRGTQGEGSNCAPDKF